ncbi:hypothetical protein MW290_24680 [Aquincola tertiaricarbonis]|uniref:Uncharacterized protein n=1 Tax=Aquincola tertiaricarbonis TaxID=391953 RepID=A0ABY4S5S7_AQUTE|nr:hypothetical protein [Aquincola tertiaricarbonis]URI08776.1 hypothetical protein MW290_24680 [Aquincola tertiaricarbonis]
MDKREFWTTKSKLAEYHAVVFEHPAFEAPFRLVANQFQPVTLAGALHTPVPMDLRAPEQKRGSQPKLQLAFPRPVVGREFKRQLRRISAAGSRAPIAVTYAVYLGNTDAPQVTWQLYAAEAGGVTFSGDQVQVTATDNNPMRRSAAEIYDPNIFTGLQLL